MSANKPANSPAGNQNRPMMIAIIEHDMKHPVTDPTNPQFRTTWLAFNPVTRKVMVEVEADTPAGLQAFRDHYGIGKPNAKGEARDTHALPDDPNQWRSLIGEREADDDSADPMKHIKRRDRMRERFQREADERAERERRQAGNSQASPVTDQAKDNKTK